MARLTGEAWGEITKIQRDSQGHYPQGSVLAEETSEGRAKVSESTKTSQRDSRGGRSLPVGLRRVSSPVWFSVPSLVLCPSGLRRPRHLPWSGAGPRARVLRTGSCMRHSRVAPRLGRQGAGLGRMPGNPEAEGGGGATQVSPRRRRRQQRLRGALAPCTRCAQAPRCDRGGGRTPR